MISEPLVDMKISLDVGPKLSHQGSQGSLCYCKSRKLKCIWEGLPCWGLAEKSSLWPLKEKPSLRSTRSCKGGLASFLFVSQFYLKYEIFERWINFVSDHFVTQKFLLIHWVFVPEYSSHKICKLLYLIELWLMDKYFEVPTLC